jgi:hypothetical protein
MMTTQIYFEHRDMLEMLIKKAGVHEGRWTISVTFNFAAVFAGPSPEQTAPGAMIYIQQIGIASAVPGTPGHLILDAAIVNPRPEPEPASNESAAVISSPKAAPRKR